MCPVSSQLWCGKCSVYLNKYFTREAPSFLITSMSWRHQMILLLLWGHWLNFISVKNSCKIILFFLLFLEIVVAFHNLSSFSSLLDMWTVIYNNSKMNSFHKPEYLLKRLKIIYKWKSDWHQRKIIPTTDWFAQNQVTQSP